jgi:rSAM/selenodomain-associated transferase 1
MSVRYALGVMLKAPVPGRVKTRLVPPLSEDEAAGLYRVFIIDIFERLSSLDGIDIHAFYAPPEEEDKIVDIVPKGIPLISQKGSNLGERIYNVFDHLLTLEGYPSATVIGTDSPDLPLEYVKEAYMKLDEIKGGLVLGPTTDGGYYLIAMDRLSRTPFEDIPWSTDRVLAVTWRRARSCGIPVRLLKIWYDVDTVEDLVMVRDIKKAPETCRFIEEKGLV